MASLGRHAGEGLHLCPLFTSLTLSGPGLVRRSHQFSYPHSLGGGRWVGWLVGWWGSCPLGATRKREKDGERDRERNLKHKPSMREREIEIDNVKLPLVVGLVFFRNRIGKVAPNHQQWLGQNCGSKSCFFFRVEWFPTTRHIKTCIYIYIHIYIWRPQT